MRLRLTVKRWRQVCSFESSNLFRTAGADEEQRRPRGIDADLDAANESVAVAKQWAERAQRGGSRDGHHNPEWPGRLCRLDVA